MTSEWHTFHFTLWINNDTSIICSDNQHASTLEETINYSWEENINSQLNQDK